MSSHVDAPTPSGAAARWVRSLLSLSVGVVIGLAPYLGTKGVPLFKPLLEMIPDALRDSTIPLSAALMGIVAVAVQWFDGERVSRRSLGRWFLSTLILSIVALFTFMWMHTTYTVTVHADGGAVTQTFAVGASRPPSCTCAASASDEECINGLTWNTAAISRCWGDRVVRQSGLLLRLGYLTSTTLFGVLVGLLVLRPALRR